MALWADLACVGLNADVKFLLLGDFRQLPAVLDSWAGPPISAPLEHSQQLTENMRSDPGIFNFVKWLRVGEEACPTLEQAKARLRELYPSKPGWPDTTLVISHSKRMAVNAAANRALAPEASKRLELETQVIHIDLGTHTPGVSVTLTLAANPWNIVRTYNLTPGRELLFACRYRLGTASNFVVHMSEADNVYDPLYGSFAGDQGAWSTAKMHFTVPPNSCEIHTSGRTSRHRACPTRRQERWTFTASRSWTQPCTPATRRRRTRRPRWSGTAGRTSASSS